MELRYIDKEISQLATMEALGYISEHGKEKLKEFRYLKNLHESKVKNWDIHGVVFSEERSEVCTCSIYHGYPDHKVCSLCKKPLYPK